MNLDEKKEKKRGNELSCISSVYTLDEYFDNYRLQQRNTNYKMNDCAFSVNTAIYLIQSHAIDRNKLTQNIRKCDVHDEWEKGGETRRFSLILMIRIYIYIYWFCWDKNKGDQLSICL